jgi:hypothetical protein
VFVFVLFVLEPHRWRNGMLALIAVDRRWSSVILLLPLFVLDQHAELDFNSASSLKQQSSGRHVAPLGHIILIPSQPVFALSP